jgi:hypothetical protein
MARGLALVAAGLLGFGRFAGADDHPCAAEVESACPERPGSELGACLKDKNEHENPTEISSACTDFMALNKACAEDIEKFCDGAFFSDDTIICLTQWTEQENLSPRCQSVMEWAVPKKEEAEEEVVTDELGMSDQDREEKEEWRAKRKAVRDEAIGRMKMKEEDRKKEEDRVALEEFREADPEGYADMIRQQEEEKRQQAEFRRMERKRQAAFERKQKEAAGLLEEDEQPKATTTGKKSKQKTTSWVYSALSFLFVGAVVYGIYVLVVAPGTPPARGGGASKQKQSGKKKR